MQLAGGSVSQYIQLTFVFLCYNVYLCQAIHSAKDGKRRNELFFYRRNYRSSFINFTRKFSPRLFVILWKYVFLLLFFALPHAEVGKLYE